MQTFYHHNINNIKDYFNENYSIKITDPKNTIQEFNEYFNSKNGVLKNYYFYICLDESASMKGSKWKKALNSVEKFIKYLNIYACSDTRVSFSCFNHTCRNIFEFEKITNKLEQQVKNTKIKPGNTDFAPILDIALESIIKNTDNTIDKSLIIMITDGISDYPKQQIEQLKKLINKGNNIKLQWILIIGE